MASRLRVLLVGTTPGEVADLRRRLAGRPDFDIVRERVLDGQAPANAAVSPEIDLVVLSPRALAQGSPVIAGNVRARAQPDADDDLVEHLTPRERDVLALVADGLGNRAVAEALGISEHTVKFHLASIFGKLGASSRTEAVQRGLRLGFIDI